MPTIEQFLEYRRKWREANPVIARLQDRLHELQRRQSLQEVEQLICWPTCADAARAARVNPGQISRLAASGVLRTNGWKGRSRRIDPLSLVQYVLERWERERAGSDAWARCSHSRYHVVARNVAP